MLVALRLLTLRSRPAAGTEMIFKGDMLVGVGDWRVPMDATPATHINEVTEKICGRVGSTVDLVLRRGEGGGLQSAISAVKGKKVEKVLQGQEFTVTLTRSGGVARAFWLRSVARLERHTGSVRTMAFDGARYLATGGNDRNICIWDVSRMGKPSGRLQGHQKTITKIVWCPAFGGLASSDAGGNVFTWDVRGGGRWVLPQRVETGDMAHHCLSQCCPSFTTA